jgi:hypothetical protein
MAAEVQRTMASAIVRKGGGLERAEFQMRRSRIRERWCMADGKVFLRSSKTRQWYGVPGRPAGRGEIWFARVWAGDRVMPHPLYELDYGLWTSERPMPRQRKTL